MIFYRPMLKTIAYVMTGAVLFACGNNQAQPETASSPIASAPMSSSSGAPAASSAAPVASASTASAPVASASAAPAADEGVVVQIKGNLIMLNGGVAGALGDTRLDELSARLKGTREFWLKLHPSQTFPGRATIKAEKTTPTAAVTHILDVAHAAGYPNAAVTTQ